MSYIPYPQSYSLLPTYRYEPVPYAWGQARNNWGYAPDHCCRYDAFYRAYPISTPQPGPGEAIGYYNTDRVVNYKAHPEEPPRPANLCPAQDMLSNQKIFDLPPTEERFKQQAQEERDIWRDTMLRYAGYFNELAASWKHILVLPSVLGPKWGKVAFHSLDKATPLYCLLDALDKGRIALRKGNASGLSANERYRSATFETLSAVAFQYLASWKIPVIFVEKTRDYTAKFIKNSAAFKRNPLIQQIEKNLLRGKVPMRLLVPAVISSAIIPIIIHPIDWAVEKLVHYGVNPLVRTVLNLDSDSFRG